MDKFKAMQDCFRAHPEVYADGMSCVTLSVISLHLLTSFLSEIMDDDDDEAPKTADDTSTAPPSERGIADDALSQDMPATHEPVKTPVEAAPSPTRTSS